MPDRDIQLTRREHMEAAEEFRKEASAAIFDATTAPTWPGADHKIGIARVYQAQARLHLELRRETQP